MHFHTFFFLLLLLTIWLTMILLWRLLADYSYCNDARCAELPDFLSDATNCYKQAIEYIIHL
jgi:hypothetical protein